MQDGQGCNQPILGLPAQFGTQDGSERNTRFLHERLGWDGLLMDGGFENPAINLQREFITPVRGLLE